MGNDGGSFAHREEMVKQKKKEIKIDNKIQAKLKAKQCKVSEKALKQPIATCRLGNLYNYEDILKSIATKNVPEDLKYIKKCKEDLRVLKIKESKGSEFLIECPMSQIQYNGITPFVTIWKCGCVFSKKVLQKDNHCPVCGEAY